VSGEKIMNAVEIKVRDISDFKSVEVIEILVKLGDTVKVDQSLITVESDKASMEIPSSHAGVITELKVKIGDKIAEGSLLAIVTASGTAPSHLRRLPPHPQFQPLHQWSPPHQRQLSVNIRP
jgi:pyruvate/2-oxoglutarate dehydrogenase complex dihydrolipoamide acyltransferase (E2) component